MPPRRRPIAAALRDLQGQLAHQGQALPRVPHNLQLDSAYWASFPAAVKRAERMRAGVAIPEPVRSAAKRKVAARRQMASAVRRLPPGDLRRLAKAWRHQPNTRTQKKGDTEREAKAVTPRRFIDLTRRQRVRVDVPGLDDGKGCQLYSGFHQGRQRRARRT